MFWEFGVNSHPQAKAQKDYAARVKSVPAAERANATFVFVTPRTALQSQHATACRSEMELPESALDERRLSDQPLAEPIESATIPRFTWVEPDESHFGVRSALRWPYRPTAASSVSWLDPHRLLAHSGDPERTASVGIRQAQPR